MEVLKFLKIDGSQEGYYYKPKENDFQYEEFIIENVKGTVGSIAYGDVDNDGFTEVFLPNYNSNDVHVFTFKP